MASIMQIQTTLSKAGFAVGPIDGIMGRRTRAAVIAFQRSNLLSVDGIIGPETLAALFPTPDPHPLPTIPAHMPWLDCAFGLLGTREQPGKGSDEAIIGWAQALKIYSYDDDDIPWCGLFVAHCIGSQLPEENLPGIPLRARAWQSFGYETSPQLGTLLVFWRGSEHSGLGHVGFYWAEDDQAYHVLGGNQSDSVSITRIDKHRLLSARWPSTATVDTSYIVKANANGKRLSINEA